MAFDQIIAEHLCCRLRWKAPVNEGSCNSNRVTSIGNLQVDETEARLGFVDLSSSVPLMLYVWDCWHEAPADGKGSTRNLRDDDHLDLGLAI